MTLAPSSFDPFADYLSLACLAAVMRSDAPQTIACLLAGADADLADPTYCRTILHWAAFRGLVDVIRVARRCGASEQELDRDGFRYTDLLSASDTPKVPNLSVVH